MNLLVVIINEENMDKVIHIFMGTGIRGATIIDSVGMGRVISSSDIPIFAGINKITNGSFPQKKTIFSVVKDETILDETIKLLTKNIDFNKPNVGIFFVLPISRAYGIDKIN
ncbi:hypothetical protein HZA55_03785 [Candidatus Poribacteria bacterium]|nr:hypothetical protein [Candidatus Poribacteria bacterium]